MPTSLPISITVIGGYLGAGKTSLLNRLLQQASGRRIGVIVNDFGELGIDVALLRAAIDGTVTGGVPIVNLANGCVCCTLGDDLRASLETLRSIDPPLDHIVIEASGVADPSTAAAWGTVPGFVPGGVIVLAAADSVVRSARDRYVGSEVLRQVAGADLLLVTKTDLVDRVRQSEVIEWLGTVSRAPILVAAHGAVSIDVVLGAAAHPVVRSVGDEAGDDHRARYLTWRTEVGAVTEDRLRAFLDRLPAGVLRAKGAVVVTLSSGEVEGRLIQVVGRSVAITPTSIPDRAGIEAIGTAGVLDTSSLELLADGYLRAR